MELAELRQRYTPAQLRVVDQYIHVLAATRKTGKIAPSVLAKEMEYWSRFPPEVVVEALQIHIRKYPAKKEAYTRGIMRELARERGEASAKAGAGHPERGGYGRGRYRGHYIDGSDESNMPF